MSPLVLFESRTEKLRISVLDIHVFVFFNICIIRFTMLPLFLSTTHSYCLHGKESWLQLPYVYISLPTRNSQKGAFVVTLILDFLFILNWSPFHLPFLPGSLSYVGSLSGCVYTDTLKTVSVKSFLFEKVFSFLSEKLFVTMSLDHRYQFYYLEELADRICFQLRFT